MFFSKTPRPQRRRLLFFSFHYPPDQSAGAIRTRDLVQALVKQDPSIDVTVFCSVPRRYGRSADDWDREASRDQGVRIRRFWIPYLGQGPMAAVLSYGFYFAQAVPAAILLRPQIVVGTSAKLLTSFVAACAAHITRAHLFIDFRDTFADNFFYFYRWHKRILFQSLIMAIENMVLRCAYSINMVSIGFKEAFVGWERVLAKYSITLTNFPNGIDRKFRNQISAAAATHRPQSHAYRIVYAGNLGEGQDILGLLSDLASREDLQRRMRQSGFQIDVYGSGAQLNAIKVLIDGEKNEEKRGPLAGLVRYCGLLSREEMTQVYANVDCLMLQLGLYSSLSMVIPTKVFEYAATPFPIVFGAAGFTYSFISQISGTLPFEQSNAESLLAAIEESRVASIDCHQRGQFLDLYDSSAIYTEYASHILELDDTPSQVCRPGFSMATSRPTGLGVPRLRAMNS
jgi:hypothetical protein